MPSQTPAKVANARPEKSRKQEIKPAKKGEKLRAFRGNPFEAYYNHDMHDFPRPGKMILGFYVGGAGFLTKLCWRWTVEDGKLLWEDKSPRVIVMNHQSMLDPVIAFISLYFHGIRARFVYKNELDKSKFVSWVVSRCGGIPVARGEADMQFVRCAKAALQRGECVFIFPEGTRIKADDQPIEIHKGFALVARLAKVPVQPMAIVGARDVHPKGSHLLHFPKVYMKAGKPIEFNDLQVKSRKEMADAMEKASMEAVYELRDQLRAEHPGSK